jgi:long-chain acyl-CoA synthetase
MTMDALDVRSATMAGLSAAAAAAYGDSPALLRADPAASSVTYKALHQVAIDVAAGLIARGVQALDRVALLCQTRPEWVVAHLGISMTGATVVPIFPSSSEQECAWILRDSSVSAAICETKEQANLLAGLVAQGIELHTVVCIDAQDDQSLDALRASATPAARGELLQRVEKVSARDPYTIIYTSGTTGPAKGCLITHGNYRAGIDMVAQRSVLRGQDDLVYLFLPLAHSFALLVQMAALDSGTPVAHWGGSTDRLVAELRLLRPTYLPCVPRIFEKIYRQLTAALPPTFVTDAVNVGEQVRDLTAAGALVPAELQRRFDSFDTELFSSVRALFGGRLRQASSGAAPIAPSILRFFWAAGVPVMEGYGMTETATAVTASTPEEHRFGSVGKPVPGVDIHVAPDGEILVRGPNVFHGYLNNEAATRNTLRDGWLHTGDLGAFDDDGYLSIVGRKKDIIITAGGKNLTPANIENELKQSPFISQAVMHGDGRPYATMLVTLDADEISSWALQQGLAGMSPAELAGHSAVRMLVQLALDRINSKYAPIEQVKKFFILERDLTYEAGELTASLKVKRDVVNNKFKTRFDELYAD